MKNNNDFQITNKPAFYTGLAMQLGPIAIGVIIATGYAISKLDFAWVIEIFRIMFTVEKIKYYLIGLAVLLYYTMSGLLVYLGVKK